MTDNTNNLNETSSFSTSAKEAIIMPPSAPSSRRCWKHVNAYWIAVSSLCSWFLFWHSPMVLRKTRWDNVFLLHIVGAYTITIACMTNTLTTPSVAGKTWHIWVGRVGMFSGILSFVAGALVAWWPWRSSLPPRAFAIGITIGGIFQVAGQYNGYMAIQKYRRLKAEIQSMELDSKNQVQKNDNGEGDRKRLLISQRDEAFKDHVRNMIGVFAAGCGCPAGIRLLNALGVPYLPGLILSVGGLVGVVGFWSEVYFKRD